MSLELSPDEKEAKAIINIDNPPKQMSSVSVAVWGAQDGQNDLEVVYREAGGVRRMGGRHQHKNHKEAGAYLVDTYINYTNGESLCRNKFMYSKAYPTVQTTIGTYDADSGTFEFGGARHRFAIGRGECEVPGMGGKRPGRDDPLV